MRVIGIFPIRYPNSRECSIARWVGLTLLLVLASLGASLSVSPIVAGAEPPSLFQRSNLVAWCIVPFDSKRRGPEARAEMLRRWGFTRFAYDWRAEHIPSFDEEMKTLKRWGIRLSAFWFPAALNEEAKIILDVLRRNRIQTELWVTLGGEGTLLSPEEQARRVSDYAEILRPVVAAAAQIGCKVGLYNHGGWFGEPENQIEIIRALNQPNVGIVYNLHHGHDHIDRLPELLEKIKPYLLCLNLNGMTPRGDQIGKKILPIGTGDLDLGILQTIQASGYQGPIGILGHTPDDAEETLRDNLDGLDWLLEQLDGSPPKRPRPPLRVGAEKGAYGAPSKDERFGRALLGGMVMEGSPAFRVPPLTVECWCRLHSRANYNILVASDTKASGAHWEVFTEAGSGNLTLYLPGSRPDHVRADRMICDGKWHHVGLELRAERARLHLDGDLVADQGLESLGLAPVPGGLAFGRLVEGGFGCDGEIDDVRISRGQRALAGVPSAPLQREDDTLALWSFDDLPLSQAVREPDVEDPTRRAELPEFQVIAAAGPEELTPAEEIPKPEHFTQWHRSHGDASNTRYSSLTQINRENIQDLTLAWTYHSGDGAGNIQCNPIIVDGVLYAPTVGDHLVALDARTGVEKWRFKPEGRPAFRGLLYWAGDGDLPPRLLFNAGSDLWALNPRDGAPIPGFGNAGRIQTGEVRVAGAVYNRILVIPGFEKDVFGYDLATGEKLWTFHTLPEEGEYGRDTWSQVEQGANCWGGMAMDEQRGIAFVSTGSPKPNFVGVRHHGENLFANCVIAIDARSGKRLWHFQEIRHDIWDLDIPAPPNLVSVTHEGRRVDAVAQVTKLGNTLLLDRVSGKPLFPFRLRRAPVSKIPGERTWPYQPDPELPEPFARQEFTLEEITDLSDEAYDSVRANVTKANMGWFEAFEENKPTVFYGIHGGAEWTGAAVDPFSGRLYVSSNELPWSITLFRPDPVTRDPNAPPTPGQTVYECHCSKCHGMDRKGVGMAPPLQGLARRMNDAEVTALLQTGRNAMPAAPLLTAQERKDLLDFLFNRDIDPSQASRAPQDPLAYTFNGYNRVPDPENNPGCRIPWGTLNCLDLNTGKLVWKVPLGTYPDLAATGETDTGAENFGGAMVTAGGLVFCAGTPDAKIRAFDRDTGAQIWEHELPWGGYAPPASYEVDGRQYVVISATGGGKLGGEMGDAWVAFALRGAE